MVHGFLSYYVYFANTFCLLHRVWVHAKNKESNAGYNESDRLGGYDPYSSSKACSEIITNAYRQSFFSSDTIKYLKKGIASARAGNVIGGGDWAVDRLFPDAAKSFNIGNKVFIRNYVFAL